MATRNSHEAQHQLHNVFYQCSSVSPIRELPKSETPLCLVSGLYPSSNFLPAESAGASHSQGVLMLCASRHGNRLRSGMPLRGCAGSGLRSRAPPRRAAAACATSGHDQVTSAPQPGLCGRLLSPVLPVRPPSCLLPSFSSPSFSPPPQAVA